MVARAIAFRPQILILDEAYRGGAEAERHLYRRLTALGCTLVVASRDLAAVRDADDILLLDGGRIVGRGTFGQLRGVRERIASPPRRAVDRVAEP